MLEAKNKNRKFEEDSGDPAASMERSIVKISGQRHFVKIGISCFNLQKGWVKLDRIKGLSLKR